MALAAGSPRWVSPQCRLMLARVRLTVLLENLGTPSTGEEHAWAVTDDAFQALALTNYGHFTTMRVQNGRVRGLTLHLDRLTRDCAALFGVQLDPDFVRARVASATAGAGPITARVTVSDPAFSLAHPAGPAAPQVLVTTRPAVPDRQPPLRVRSTHYVRDLPAIKHTGLLGPLYERRQAQLAGYDDAVFVSADGLLSEGVTWNLGFIEKDALIWPAADVLPGVTTTLLNTAHRAPIRTEPVALTRLPAMSAAFATNAAGGIRPIAAIDGVNWPAEHPALTKLRADYAAIEPEQL